MWVVVWPRKLEVKTSMQGCVVSPVFGSAVMRFAVGCSIGPRCPGAGRRGRTVARAVAVDVAQAAGEAGQPGRASWVLTKL